MDFVYLTNDTDITVDLGTTADNFVAPLRALVTLITATVRSSLSDLSMDVIYRLLLLIDLRANRADYDISVHYYSLSYKDVGKQMCKGSHRRLYFHKSFHFDGLFPGLLR